MPQPALFGTVGKKDSFKLFEGKLPRYNRIQEILDFDTNQMVNSTGVPKEKIRKDSRMPKLLKQRLSEIASVIDLVGNFFDDDIEKTTRWFRLPNPALGNISPRDMIRYGI